MATVLLITVIWEKAAEICVKVRSMGGKKQTISTQNFLDLARDFKIDLNKTFLK